VKQTRARSEEAKKILYNKILEEGRNIFLEFGTKNFTMRALAERLNLTQGSLYTYVKSKRELWYAIVMEDLFQIENELNDIKNNHTGKKLDLLEELIIYFFETLKTNNRHLILMFQTNPPISKEVGPIEKEFEVGIIRILDEIIKEAVINKEIKLNDTSKLALFLWNLMYGNAIIAYTDIFGIKENLPGYSTPIEYYSYVINLINRLITSLKKR